MKVTAQLLKKYAAGKCTPEERRLIENWIPGDEDITVQVPDEKLKQISAQVWQHITANPVHKPQHAFRKPIIRFAVAASILICATYGSIKLYRSHVLSMQEAQASLKIMPLTGGNVHLANAADLSHARLRACGNIVLRNTQSRDVSLDLVTSCDAGKAGYLRHQKLKAGKTYILVQYNSTSGPRHLVVEKRHARLALADLLNREDYKSIIKRIFI